jgi:hypothetical protein
MAVSVCILCLIPGLFLLFEKIILDQHSNYSFLLIALTCLLAYLIRRAYLPWRPERAGFWEDFKLTHTAVALGCIPAVLVVLFSPSLITDHQEVIRESLGPLTAAKSQKAGILMKALIVLCFAAWAAITEEIIYRYCLISIVRRSKIASTQRARDCLAVGLSSLIFAGSHIVFWGLPAAIALFGLGIGFSLAYLANSERIAPVLCYHFLFDVLSLTAALAL